MLIIITFIKKLKLLNIVNMIYYNYFQFYKNVNKTFYEFHRRFFIIKRL